MIWDNSDIEFRVFFANFAPEKVKIGHYGDTKSQTKERL
jgi:hypothetical protein